MARSLLQFHMTLMPSEANFSTAERIREIPPIPYVAPPLLLKTASLDNGDSGATPGELSGDRLGGVWMREGLLDFRGILAVDLLV